MIIVVVIIMVVMVIIMVMIMVVMVYIEILHRVLLMLYSTSLIKSQTIMIIVMHDGLFLKSS